MSQTRMSLSCKNAKTDNVSKTLSPGASRKVLVGFLEVPLEAELNEHADERFVVIMFVCVRVLHVFVVVHFYNSHVLKTQSSPLQQKWCEIAPPLKGLTTLVDSMQF